MHALIPLATHALLLAGPIGSVEKEMIPAAADTSGWHVLLIGASIGEGWNFPDLPERLGLGGLTCDYTGVYDFDKTRLLEEALHGGDRRPDVVIIKECAAYFPGNLDHYRSLVKGWVDLCRATGVEMIPATVVPVAPKRTAMLKLKAWVKRLLTGRSGRNEQLREYNDWLRQYAREEGLEIPDLEAFLRISEAERSLRNEYDGGDGLHINVKAYEELDRHTLDLLKGRVRREG